VIDRQQQQAADRDQRAQRREQQRLANIEERRARERPEFPDQFAPEPDQPRFAPVQGQPVMAEPEHQQQQPPIGRPTLREAPRYDGKESFSSYCRTFNDFVNAHLYGEQESRRMLPFLLTGTARDAYDSLTQDVLNGPFDQLLTQLQLLIHTEEKQLVAQTEISTLSQGGRNVDTYYRVCKELVNKAYPGADQAATRNAMLLSAFISGLNDNLRIHVQRGMPRTPESALQIAKREEALRNVSTSDAMNSAIEKLTAKVDQINFIQGNHQYNNRGNYRGNGHANNNRGYPRGNSRGNGYRGGYNGNGMEQNNGFRGRQNGYGYQNGERHGYGYQNGERHGNGYQNGERHGNGQGSNFHNAPNRGGGNRGSGRGRGNFGHRVNAVFDPCESLDNYRGVNSVVGSSGVATKLLFISCLSVLLATTDAWTAVKPSKFYDCSQPIGQALISPPEPTDCIIPNPVQVRRGYVQMFVLNQTLEEIEAFKCRIEVYKQCVSSAVWIPHWNTSFVQMEKPSKYDCLQAAEYKMWRGMKLELQSSGLLQTDIEYNWPSNGFSESDCNEARRMVVEKGTVAELHDGTLAMSLMENRKKCRIEDQQCDNDEVITVWKSQQKKSICRTRKIGDFSATIGDNILVVDQMEHAFPLDKEFKPSRMQQCFKNGTLSSNGVAFFIFEEEPEVIDLDVSTNATEETTNPLSADQQNSNVSTTLSIVSTTASSNNVDKPIDVKPPVKTSRKKRTAEKEEFQKEEVAGANSVGSAAHTGYMKDTYDGGENIRRNFSFASLNHKIQYVATRLDTHGRNNFNRLVDALCHTRNRQLKMWHIFLRLDTQAAMRVLLNRDDIVASFRGRDVVQVSQCTEVIVNKINLDRRNAGGCTAKTAAMTTNNTLVYIRPGSIEVDYSTETVECSLVSNYVWEDEEGNFKEVNQTRNVTKYEDEHKLPTYESHQLVFSAGDIYAGVKGSSFPLMLAVSFGASIRSLQWQHQQDMLRVKSGSSKEVSDGNGQRPKDYIFNIATTAVEKAQSWFGMAIYFYIGAGILTLVVLGIAAYCFCKFHPGAKMVSAALNINQVDADKPDEADAPEEEVNAIAMEEQPRRDIVRVYGGYQYPPLLTFIPIIIPLICCTSAVNAIHSIPYVQITIGDKGMVALWDSGASVSYVSRSAANHLLVSIKQGKIRNAKAANGTSFEFLGTFESTIRIAGHVVEHEFLVAEDHCCPGNALLGVDFMETLDRKGISTSLRPALNKLIIGNTSIDLIGPSTQIYEVSNVVMEMVNGEDVVMQPGEEHLIKLANAADIETNQAVLLKSSPEGSLLFEKTIFHPLDSRETMLRVRNTTKDVIRLAEGDIIGHGKVVSLNSLEKPAVPDIPAEANWEDQLLITEGVEFMQKIDWSGSELNATERKQLKEIFKKNKDAFFNEDGKIGLFKGGIEHAIEIRQDLPFPKSRNYRVPIGNQAEVERQVNEMLSMDIIEPSTSTFTSPIVLVKKKDGTFRFTTDFRGLNAVTVKQIYLLPLISDIVDLASHGKFFTNLDLIQGFFQIPLRKQDRPLTSFSTPNGTFQYKRMPMGLCGAPHTFQSAVQQLQKMTRARLFCYLDDLLIVSDSREQHLTDIEEVLQNIITIGFKIKIQKCKFSQREVTFLGLLVGREGVKPNPDKVRSIKDFPTPKSVTGVRAFIGMTNYFRRFIRQFAQLAAPLYDLMKKDAPFVWEQPQQKAFEDLKTALCSSPVLQAPRSGVPFVIESDASSIAVGAGSIAVGALLLQVGEDGELHPIAYDSRKLTVTERKYPPIETEALGLAFAVTAFRTYILGSQVTAIVDHRPLTSLMHRRDLIGRLAKYQIILQELNLNIVYRPGRLNSVCDALSRYIGDEVKETREKPVKKEETKEVNVLNDSGDLLDHNAVKRIQQSTSWIDRISKELDAPNVKSTHQYEKLNGIVYRKNKEGQPSQILLPRDKDLICKIMRQYHRSAHLGAHAGVEKTLACIGRRFFWTQMLEDVTSCMDRGQRLHADICGPFPITAEGNRYIFTIKDDFTKYVLAFPIIKQDATTIADVFVKEVVLKYGSPKVLLTDNGSNFKSVLFEKVLELVSVKHSFSAPYHKAANGSIERTHRTIEESLSSFVNSDQTDWDQKLPFVIFALNSAPHSVTKVSPHAAMFGRELTTPEDHQLGKAMLQYRDVDDYEANLQLHLQDLHQAMEDRMERQGERAAEVYRKTVEKDRFVLLP
ncbi:hypothetical protein CAEBREN_32143, partial [Caenorhabditis brenneri]